MSETLLTTAEAAQRLGVTVRRVQALAKVRQVGTRYGLRLILFTAADLEALKPGPVGRPPSR